jgi:hypothetical protein
MAWGGKIKTRMGVKQRNYFLRNSNRRLPRRDNPKGVPTPVMKALAQEHLPPIKENYTERLTELLAAYKLNGGG